MQDDGGLTPKWVLKGADARGDVACRAVVGDQSPHGALVDQGRRDIADADEVDVLSTGIDLGHGDGCTARGRERTIDRVRDLLHVSPGLGPEDLNRALGGLMRLRSVPGSICHQKADVALMLSDGPAVAALTLSGVGRTEAADQTGALGRCLAGGFQARQYDRATSARGTEGKHVGATTDSSKARARRSAGGVTIPQGLVEVEDARSLVQGQQFETMTLRVVKGG